ncbi:cupin domain-containing protein [Novosphingobium sp. P6W]|uniref:cupin domain-containing protein n=1 Tax=Novosphingobium sp. P6W TaxID=1609758 RepID=UPI000A8BA5DC|nr:hypothetical protein [Novosphingobium sp. P6W]
MPIYSLDHDADYWQSPDRFRSMFDQASTIGNKASLFAIGDPNDDATPMAFILQMEPGFVITRHAHPCDRFETIVRGTLEVDGRTLYPGDVLTHVAHELYGPKTAGPDGCTTVEVFARAVGAYERITEQPDGGRKTANLIDDFQGGFAEQVDRFQANRRARETQQAHD